MDDPRITLPAEAAAEALAQAAQLAFDFGQAEEYLQALQQLDEERAQMAERAANARLLAEAHGVHTKVVEAAFRVAKQRKKTIACPDELWQLLVHKALEVLEAAEDL